VPENHSLIFIVISVFAWAGILAKMGLTPPPEGEEAGFRAALRHYVGSMSGGMHCGGQIWDIFTVAAGEGELIGKKQF
jgi:hypothetical protein